MVEDPFVRLPHQIANFVRFCETVVKAATVRSVTLVTSYDERTDLADIQEKLDELKQSLLEYDVALEFVWFAVGATTSACGAAWRRMSTFFVNSRLSGALHRALSPSDQCGRSRWRRARKYPRQLYCG